MRFFLEFLPNVGWSQLSLTSNMNIPVTFSVNSIHFLMNGEPLVKISVPSQFQLQPLTALSFAPDSFKVPMLVKEFHSESSSLNDDLKALYEAKSFQIRCKFCGAALVAPPFEPRRILEVFFYYYLMAL
jgi:hypothetical protein